jgi:hypothetical protein
LLSRTEMEFLKEPERFDANYTKALRHRIRGRVEGLREELGLLERAGYLKVTENCYQGYRI